MSLSRISLLWLLVLSLSCAGSQRPALRAAYDVQEKTLAQLQADLNARRVTSEQLVTLYLERIAGLDRAGPELHSVISLNPRAQADARSLDAERAAGRVRGPLHGIPILVKDNIESADPLPTTAGSLALTENLTGRDAPVVARLRAAGAIVLGKSNLSEWAAMRSRFTTSGWSAVGGLSKNPYALDRNACGSSSGSGVGVAANLTALAIGTETDGSITCPASVLGVVGLKPTVGLVSRTHIVPITTLQDTAGPMTRTVADAASLLTAMAGPDPADPATQEATQHATDYAAALSPDALRGRRFGLMQFHAGFLPQVDALLAAAVVQLRAAGAEVVVIERCARCAAINDAELPVLLGDFRRELNAYLQTTPASVRTRSLADVIAWNREHATEELQHFPQDFFERAEATASHDPQAFETARAANQQAARDTLAEMLAAHGGLDALIAPTIGPAWPSDFVNGDHILGGAMTLPAVAGFPHLSVPMGRVEGLPVGLSFIGPAWSEAKLLALGHAYEQRTHLRRPPALAP